MASTTRKLTASLPYVLPVLGAAVGMFWARYGTENSNPVTWVVVGALVGAGIARIFVKYMENKQMRGTFDVKSDGGEGQK